MLTDNNARRTVFVGVDTHRDSHTAVIVDQLGSHLTTIEIPTDRAGYCRLIETVKQAGNVEVFGIEGTGSYGKTLTSQLVDTGFKVVEINRPNRQHRRRHGKTDETDALSAARAVASGSETTLAKETTGSVGIVRLLHNTRRTAMKWRTQTTNQFKALLDESPDNLKHQLQNQTILKAMRTAANYRPVDCLDSESQMLKQTLKSLAKRWQQLTGEIKELDQQLDQLINKHWPHLLATKGVGVDVAAKLVVTAGSNPERLKTAEQFKALCGVSPVNASSGKTQRHRLNQGGNRQANNALYTIAITRLAHDPETQQYATKQKQKGKTNKEIIRQLKTYIARQTWKQLTQNQPKT